VYEHSARAISNSLEHNTLFLMPLWRAIGHSRWMVQARTLPKTVTIGAAVLLVILALIVVPWDFDMRAKGALEPVVKREVFAPSAGEVTEVLADNGQEVAEGEPLVKLRNPDLAIKIKQVEGELNAAVEELNGIRARLTSSGASRGSAQERARDEGQFARVQVQIASLREQLGLLTKREEQLTVKSPIAGRVITWEAKKVLQNRPVETGQVLMTVAAKDSEYEIELFMPERRAKHLTSARDKVKADDPTQDLDVDFILMTDPGRTRTGKIVEVMDATEPHEEQGNVVRVRVKPNEPILTGRPGATVTADVHCGWAPLGWSLLHEAWEWLEANLFF
jgi:multidrug efflux pump subunit AcrA (membrane-fusion protein)